MNLKLKLKKGLFSKMVATYIVIVTLSFVFIATFLSVWFERYYFSQRREQLEKESILIKPFALDFIRNEGKYEPEEIDRSLNFFGSLTSSDIWLLDRNGYVYSVSDEKFNSIKGTQKFTKALEILRLNKIYEIKGRYDNIITQESHIYGIPVFDKDFFGGAIVMITPLSEINEPLKGVFRIIWTTALFAIFISSFIIYYFSERIIIKPLADINGVAKKISKGEVEKRVEIISNDEIGQLAESFNYMADSLEKVEKARREFISNVSHEIRSPITSIKGFIGGILDGIIPKDKENYYLSITYEEIQRLTRLVNDILDLSAIEAGQFKLRMSELDINEIIRLTVIKFEQKIKEKKLNVDVCFNLEHQYVYGDRDRLIQVMTNLIDNAIKYVSEGGEIYICTKVKADKVLVSVFNNGPSIPKEDLPKIWNRFYKSDKSRTSKVSTGLGLPIVRNILTQHGEDIWVENKEGGGVTFIFTLKRVK
ncbi:cell wall metabolism sensor histidine kinase WalK [Clostridium swellfunianum]|uniref:sensor histidine kinase n=1 Tax=Clostridium swellfunianum TaxID=1367462 RepID=UPI002030A761|nr:HAMP domain-containing sensor histidine kinase [Clostridium swellfunianum]MCM0649015.1 cell wall metabolism sensor histidine kinase WalK [Clostridium swellfunianum]